VSRDVCVSNRKREDGERWDTPESQVQTWDGHDPGHVVYLQKDKLPGRNYKARICKRCGVVYVPEKE
jgi:hypothetical protein